MMSEKWAVDTGAEKAELLLAAARYLNETLELERVYDRFHELLAEAVPHGGVIVSSFDPGDGADPLRLRLGGRREARPRDPAAAAAEPRGRRHAEPRDHERRAAARQNDVPEQVKDPAGVYYDVDREGHMRKLPDEEPPGVQSAMMLPVKHEGEVVGVVQLMHETRRRYDEEQLELAEGLIGLMAAAVRNARLHEQAQAEAAARARGPRRRPRRASRRRACSRRSATACSWSTTTACCGSGTARPSSSPAAPARTPSAAGPARSSRAGRRVAAEIPISEEAAGADPVTLPVEVDGSELWLSFVAVRSSERRRLRLPRPDGRARPRGGEERLHRHASRTSCARR